LYFKIPRKIIWILALGKEMDRKTYCFQKILKFRTNIGKGFALFIGHEGS